MNSVADGKVVRYLRNNWHYRPNDCKRALNRMRELSRVAGYDLDVGFGQAGLAAGPDARVAAGIVNRALGGGGGNTVDDHTIESTVNRWLRTARNG